MRKIRMILQLKNRSIVSFYNVVAQLSNKVDWAENEDRHQDFIQKQEKLLEVYTSSLTRMKALTQKRLDCMKEMKIWIRSTRNILEVKSILLNKNLKQQADELLSLIKNQGTIAHLGLDATKAAAMALLNVIDNQMAQNLGIEECCNKLKENYDAFVEASSERTIFISTHFNNQMQQTRKETQKAFNCLVDTASAKIFLNQGKNLENFLSLVATEIKLIKQNYSSSSTAKAEIVLEN